jgi:hypothetical protein
MSFYYGKGLYGFNNSYVDGYLHTFFNSKDCKDTSGTRGSDSIFEGNVSSLSTFIGQIHSFGPGYWDNNSDNHAFVEFSDTPLVGMELIPFLAVSCSEHTEKDSLTGLNKTVVKLTPNNFNAHNRSHGHKSTPRYLLGTLLSMFILYSLLIF